MTLHLRTRRSLEYDFWLLSLLNMASVSLGGSSSITRGFIQKGDRGRGLKKRILQIYFFTQCCVYISVRNQRLLPLSEEA